MIRRRLSATSLLAVLSSSMLLSGCASFSHVATGGSEPAATRYEDVGARPPPATAPPGLHIDPWVSSARSSNHESHPVVGLHATF